MPKQNPKHKPTNYIYSKKYHISNKSIEKRLRKDVLVERMLRCFDVQPSTPQETAHFQKKNHKTLCGDVENWINKLQVFFGEFIWVEKNQSLRDEGVDVIVYFVESKIKFGMQIKSYNDICNKQFSSKVDGQISRSKKHGISALFVLFAGNMADKTNSHPEKVNGKISDISVMKDDYTYCINPEQFYTISKTIRRKIHPMKALNLQEKDIPILTKGLVESLSNDKRDVSLNIEVKYLDIPENLNGSISFSVAFPDDDLEFSQKFRNIRNLTEKLVIPKEYITDFKVKGFSGVGVDGIPDFMEITPERYLGFLDFISIDNDGNEFAKMEYIPYKAIKEDNIIKVLNRNVEHPFSFEFSKIPNRDGLKTTFRINLMKGNARENYRTLKFLSALAHGSKLKTNFYTVQHQFKGTDLTDYSLDYGIHKHYLDFLKKLSYIEEELAVNFSFEDLSIYTKVNEIKMNDIYNALITGCPNFAFAKMTLIVSRIKVLEWIEKTINEDEMDEEGFNFNVHDTLYNKEINLGPYPVKTKGYKVEGDLPELKKKALEMECNEFEITLVFEGKDLNGKLDWFPRKQKETT